MRLVNFHPNRGGTLALGVLPFLILLFAYVVGSNNRLAENPDDKLLPSGTSFVETIRSYAFEEDRRSGEILLWVDTVASLKRIVIALAISAALGVVLGLAIGALPVVRVTLSPFVAALVE